MFADGLNLNGSIISKYIYLYKLLDIFYLNLFKNKIQIIILI